MARSSTGWKRLRMSNTGADRASDQTQNGSVPVGI